MKKNKDGVYIDYTDNSYSCGIFIKFRLKEYEFFILRETNNLCIQRLTIILNIFS